MRPALPPSTTCRCSGLTALRDSTLDSTCAPALLIGLRENPWERRSRMTKVFTLPREPVGVLASTCQPYSRCVRRQLRSGLALCLADLSAVT
jgi:hypothetical protein